MRGGYICKLFKFGLVTLKTLAFHILRSLRKNSSHATCINKLERLKGSDSGESVLEFRDGVLLKNRGVL